MPAGGDENNLQFSINYVVTDGNGDRATGSFSIDVDDDSPRAQLALLVGLAQVDETVPSGDELADPFSIGTPLGVASTKLVSLTGSLTGADSAGATTEVTLLSELGDGADSGLKTTDGTDIFLFQNGNIIEGRVGGAAGPVAFALTIDNTGLVTVAQYLSLQHLDPTNPDDSLVLSGRIAAQVTVTDGDGDVSTIVVGIGAAIIFKDDGPIAVVANATADTLVLDESPAGQDEGTGTLPRPA